jgi:hypothetical protein
MRNVDAGKTGRRGAASVMDNPLSPNMKRRAAPLASAEIVRDRTPALDTPVIAYNSAASLGRTRWKVLYALIIRRKPPIHRLELFFGPIYAVDAPELYAITGRSKPEGNIAHNSVWQGPRADWSAVIDSLRNLPVLSRHLPRNRTLILSQTGSHDPGRHARKAGVNIAHNTLPCVFARLRLPPQVVLVLAVERTASPRGVAGSLEGAR